MSKFFNPPESISSIVCREVREGHITEAKGFEVMRKCDPNSPGYDAEYKAVIQRAGFIANPPAHLVG